MNLLQAINHAGDDWFRPISWSGSGEALKKVNSHVHYDGKESDERWMCPSIYSLTGEWEMVTPEQVIGERG